MFLHLQVYVLTKDVGFKSNGCGTRVHGDDIQLIQTLDHTAVIKRVNFLSFLILIYGYMELWMLIK